MHKSNILLSCLVAICTSAIACQPPTPVTDASNSDASMNDVPQGMDVVHTMRPFPNRPGCDPMTGIQCDGDYEGKCMPECGPTQCCVPINGAFTCVDPEPNGFCPAPDIEIRADRIMGHTSVQWKYFPANACTIVERCVGGPGWRRLLLFDAVTPNRGTADMYMGPPAANADRFEYSMCHMHYHFNTYAQYRLNRMDGTSAADGHKQAFCLMDTNRIADESADGLQYTCENQGIQMGWQDVYGSYLDCQWIDVTDVATGNYTLNVSVNTAHLLNERNYENNVANIPVTITPDDRDADPTQPCPSPIEGVNRQCGLTNAGSFNCLPGEQVRVGCSNICRLGTCSGDTVLRVCPGNTPCGPMSALVLNDDSGCQPMGGGNEDYCSQGRFVCPANGRYTVLWGPLASDEMATCNPQHIHMGLPPGSDAGSDGGDASEVDAPSAPVDVPNG